MKAIEIPAVFFQTRYNGDQYPGVAIGLANGANCQHFCYEILRHFGFTTGTLRSSDLWEDETYTRTVADPEPLDLVLFNQTKDAYGAHVGIYLDTRKILRNRSADFPLPAWLCSCHVSRMSSWKW